MKADPVLDTVAAALSEGRPSLRIYLTQNYDQITQLYVTTLANGRTKREFWETLAAELARANIVGQQGRMNATVAEKAWRRIVTKRLIASLPATSSAVPRPVAPQTDEPRPRFTPISGKKL